MEGNTQCAICDRWYRKCEACKSDMRSAPWKTLTDTAEHYKIFQIIRGYDVGVYTKEDARRKLSNVDLSDLEDLKENIKEIIKIIMKD